jgi:hypothetical protein
MPTPLEAFDQKMADLNGRILDLRKRQIDLRDGYVSAVANGKSEADYIAPLGSVAHEIDELVRARDAALRGRQEATRQTRQATVDGHVKHRASLRKAALATFADVADHLAALEAASRKLGELGEEDWIARSELEAMVMAGDLEVPDGAMHVALRHVAGAVGYPESYRARQTDVVDAEDEVRAALENRQSRKAMRLAGDYEDWERRNAEQRVRDEKHPNPGRGNVSNITVPKP